MRPGIPARRVRPGFRCPPLREGIELGLEVRELGLGRRTRRLKLRRVERGEVVTRGGARLRDGPLPAEPSLWASRTPVEGTQAAPRVLSLAARQRSRQGTGRPSIARQGRRGARQAGGALHITIEHQTLDDHQDGTVWLRADVVYHRVQGEETPDGLQPATITVRVAVVVPAPRPVGARPDRLLRAAHAAIQRLW